ncbi:MAG: TetR/AcrR family transcriptional regulator [Caldilineaceae bacterium]|jgi:AcrR family transcriptional regulator|nr:TetR/AcrR family transcriptional regulator [Caldilineaceae bacterium]
MHDMIEEGQAEIEAGLSPQKQVILDAARDLFVKYGYEGLSIRDLAEQCGLAKATIYHHFQDKQDIFLSVLGHAALTMHQRIVEAAARGETPVEKLRAMVYAYCDMLVERRMVFFWSLRANAETEEQLRKFVQTHKEHLLGPLTQIVHAGIEGGDFRAVDAQMSALCLLGMLNASMAYRIMFDEVQDSADVAARALDLFLSGISTKTCQ